MTAQDIGLLFMGVSQLILWFLVITHRHDQYQRHDR